MIVNDMKLDGCSWYADENRSILSCDLSESLSNEGEVLIGLKDEVRHS